MGNDGYKLSKSRGNYTDPNELMDEYSADSLRYLILSSPVLNGEDFAVRDKDVGDIARKLSMVWNMYDFFTMYAEVDGWEWDGNHEDPSKLCENPLDAWVISRVHQLTEEVQSHMDGYDIPNAMKPILPFVEDASNWYVRRSRRRFWKSGDDADKNNAYKTLHYVLTQLSMVLAPFTPFLAEELYQKLTGGESVHLLDWPKVGHVNELVLSKMADTRRIIEAGLGQRMQKDETQEQVKVRQPLSSLSYNGPKLEEFYEGIIAEEVNVKRVVSLGTESVEREVSLDKVITPELHREGMSREVVRFVQSARKAAGLNVDDRIVLLLQTEDSELAQAITEHRETIQSETLADEAADLPTGHTTDVLVEGAVLKISLAKRT